MGVSHRYRLLSVRGPRMVMRARRGAAFCLFASALLDSSSSIKELKLFAPRVHSACALTAASNSFRSLVSVRRSRPL